MPADARRKLCEKLAVLVRSFETQSADLTRKHEAALARVEQGRLDAGAAWNALSELNQSHRAERDQLWADLRASRDPAIDETLAELMALLEELPQLRKAIRAADPRDAYYYVVGDNGASVDLYRQALERAIHQADQLSFEPLDAEAIAARLDELRASIPDVDTAEAVLQRKLREIRARGPAAPAA